jgi:hypothetical protein
MKANEKAKELLDRFLNIEGADDCGNSYSYVAQQCALICVDEIIKMLPPPIEDEWYQERLEEYNNLKEEIEKL